MEPSEYLAVLRRRWLTLLITTLLGLGASVLVMVATAPVYRTSAKVFLSTTEGKSVSELVQGSNYAQNLVQSYADLATTPVVLDRVISDLSLNTTPEELAGSVRADVTLNTVIIEISASASNGATAAAIANTVGSELAVAVRNVSPKGLKSGEAIQISPVSPAKVPPAPSWPNRKLLGALGLALGLALGVGLALLRDVWGSRIGNEEGLTRATSAPLLGTVAVNRKDGVQALGAHGAKADAFRRLEQSLSFYVTRGTTFSFGLITPKPTVGATLAAVNLAVTLAEAGRRVVLVDGDLRRPSIAEHMGLRYQRGLSRLIADQTPVDDALKDWDDGVVRVLPGGPVPPNPDELLAAPATSGILDRLREIGDVVLVHAQAASASALASRLEGFVLVVEPRTKKREVVALVAGVERAGGRVLGVVLVRASGHRRLPVERAGAPAAPWWRTGRQAAHGRPSGAHRSPDAGPAAAVIESDSPAVTDAPAPVQPAALESSSSDGATAEARSPVPIVPLPAPSSADSASNGASATAPALPEAAADADPSAAAEPPAPAPTESISVGPARDRVPRPPTGVPTARTERGGAEPGTPASPAQESAPSPSSPLEPAEPAPAADIRWEPPSLSFSERWATPADAAPFVDVFQARVPAVALEPTNGRRDPAPNGTPNGTSNESADRNGDGRGTSPSDDDERASRPEPDVSRR